MIALSILTAWLTLTAAGFAGLRTLRRVDAREEVDARLETGHRVPVLVDARMIPKALLQ